MSCTLETCEQDPVCGPLVMQYYGTHSLAHAIQLGSCEDRDVCND